MIKKNVNFIATKEITQPVKVNFTTNDGKRVSFTATKKTTQPVRVNFKARK